MQTRINNSYLLQIFIVNLIIFFWFLGYIFINILPKYSEIEEKKWELAEQISTLKRIQKEGINFQEFKDQKSKNNEQNEYLTSILKTISNTFYTKHIKNNWPDELFSTFIESKTQSIQAMKKEPSFQDRIQKIESIIPSYSQNVSSSKKWNLSDFKFVNSVESMLYAFNLTSNDQIGIGEVIPVKEFSTNNKKSEEVSNSLDTNLFYIPLRLSLFWRKVDVIDFFHYVENIWTIQVENGEIEFFKDEWSKKIIPSFSGSNIYESQVFDIESLDIPEYLDSSIVSSDIPDMIEYIKRSQGNERVDFDITLRFYVKWLPDYQIKKYIKETADMYDSLVKDIDSTIKSLTLKQSSAQSDYVIALNSLKSMLYDLQSIENEIKAIRVDMAKSLNLQETYRKSLVFSEKFLLFRRNFEWINKKLEIIFRK